jgi:hypothetical protein
VDIEECRAAAREAREALPEHVREVLARVEFEITDDPTVEWKGCFTGWPGLADDDPEVEDEGDDPCLPEGRILLAAANLADAAEVRAILLHEIAHALGFDETETALLGLGEVHDAHGPDPTA